MEHTTIAWCFLMSAAPATEILRALQTYEPLRATEFVVGLDGLECAGPGFGVKITPIVKLRAVTAEVQAVKALMHTPSRIDELQRSVMVLRIGAALDEREYAGNVFCLTPLLGERVARSALPFEAIGACEALNINLKMRQPILFDRAAGFYPS